jgi:hypothetical protein
MRSASIFSKLAPAKPTKVFDTFWKFAAERQRIFHARVVGEAYRTKDAILAQYKFTNAFRASDRVSQFLIRHVIYEGDSTPRETVFRTLLFKIFNRIETWQLLSREIGELRADKFKPRRYSQVLDEAMSRNEPVYSAAYIMPSGGGKGEFAKKHHMHFALLDRMVKDRLDRLLLNARNMKEAFLILRSYPTIGDFLAFQYLIDLNYSTLWNFSEMDFVIPGPGAIDGITKCFSDRGGVTEEEIIWIVTLRQREEFDRLGIDFENLWGRDLQLIDCQNLFCEISKYARIAHPDILGVSDRTRIKQRYRANFDEIDYKYPPKWGINDKIPIRRQSQGQLFKESNDGIQ